MDQSDFATTTTDNCASTLLTIVARGTAIYTEICRLVELIPRPFRQGDGYHLDKDRRFTLEDIVCDFSYFQNADQFEHRIESNEMLKRADEDFCDHYSDILTRFYLTFESIQRYASDLNRFMVDLEQECFVGQSLDSLLVEAESRQLLCEAYYILGHMLLTVDNNFHSDLRERLIVSHYRYSSHMTLPDSSMDETCNLLRSTGFRCEQQQTYKRKQRAKDPGAPNHRPPDYPEVYFSRARANQSVVDLLIAKLQSVDLYNQTTLIFPHPNHRSAALGQQASILYILLYFCPEIMSTQRSRMREITDKFFHDNWIINLGMGELVNLIESWEPYGAARESLGQIFDLESVRVLSDRFNSRLESSDKQMQEFLREGWLEERTYLENCSKLLNTIRESNVVLKWVLLHSQHLASWQGRLSKNLHAIVIKSQPDEMKLCSFLQDLSNLERASGHLSQQVLGTKANKLAEHKALALEILDELVSIYGQDKPVRWIKVGPNSTLCQILTKLRGQLSEQLQIDSGQSSRASAIKLINQIELARESYIDGKSLQIVQLFDELRDHLRTILRYLSLGDNSHSVIRTASEFSYAWRLMEKKFSRQLQCIIKENPFKIKAIEAVFLKLAAAFDGQVARIQQVGGAGADLISVKQYYSTKLVAYIGDVLHVIPATVLELVGSIMVIQRQNKLSDMPSKVALDSLRDYLLEEQRFEMLELTDKISHYAEAISLMQDTSIGSVRLNSGQLLEDGIRRELVSRLTEIIQKTLTFEQQTKRDPPNEFANESLIKRSANLASKLGELGSIVNGFKRSFEYIQDFLFIYGLKMWQEELGRIVRFNVEQASVALLEEKDSWPRGAFDGPSFGANGRASCPNQKQPQQYQSKYQSNKAPILVHDEDPLQASFVVRVLLELLAVTDPRETIYDEQTGAWFDKRAGRQQVVDLRMFSLIQSSLTVAGLKGLDEMCCSLLVLELQRLHSRMLELCASSNSSAPPSSSSSNSRLFGEILQQVSLFLQDPLGSSCTLRHSTSAAAAAALEKTGAGLLNQLARIGQLQAIRASASCVVSTKCRYEARHLYACLEALNETLASLLERAPLQRGPNQQKSGLEQEEEEEEIVADTQLRQGAELGWARLASGNIDDSQLVFQLVRHLEWCGLNKPMEKIYTLSLQQQQQQARSNGSTGGQEQLQAKLIALIFLLLLGHSWKLNFSRSASEYLAGKHLQAPAKSCQTLDALPVFYGIKTLLGHYEPMLATLQSGGFNQATRLLLCLMSNHVNSRLALAEHGTGSKAGALLPAQESSLLLSIIELLRLSSPSCGQANSKLLARVHLPKCLLDTFQFISAHE